MEATATKEYRDPKGNKGRRLNWKQACEMLGCSKSHFYNLINEGKLPAVRYGKVRGVWVWEKDINNHLKPITDS